MNIDLLVNGDQKSWQISPADTLLAVLRREGFFGAKFGGCDKGECGACAVLLDGKPVNSCSILAAQAGGHRIDTIEALGEHPEQGWKKTGGLHPLQQAFVETGAIQCGYCTPAMILAAKSLLDETLDPSEEQVRDTLSGVLCRCTGYEKPVQAVLRAAAQMRGELVPPIEHTAQPAPEGWQPEEGGHPEVPEGLPQTGGFVQTRVLPKIWTVPQSPTRSVVGKSEPKVDALKLVQGKPAFTADLEKRGLLIGKILHSPVAHARIKSIDVSRAKALPGVAAVLTWKDLPRVAYSTAGQSDPIPGPLDMFSLDQKVRFVGDRVAFVAAETEEIAQLALSLIDVEYEKLPAILDSRNAMQTGAVQIHDEEEYVNFADSDPKRNLAAEIRIDIGDVEKGFAEADKIYEADYDVPKVQQAHIEPHVVMTYWDEDDRMVVRTSTQVPFHVRRVLAPVLGLPIKRIRVIKPRVGGGFGGKQEILIEDVAAHLTIATGRPVLVEYNRDEEFTASRSRHPMRIHMKTGVKKDGTITANEMYALSDTGAYGCHALTVTGNTGHKSMGLYVGDGEYRKHPNIRFYADVVYTNTPPAGAFRGYGVPQGYWPLDRHLELIARDLGLDPIEFRLKNAVRAGELHPFSTAWSEGREPKPEIIHTVGLEECVRQGKAAIGWDQKFGNPAWHVVEGQPHLRRGIGITTVMQGTAIPYLDMGGASIKMNDDGSFNLLVGATDLGTGSDTVLAQMAAEVLGVPVDDIIVYSSDTDFTPFDVGAYASSTTYISGGAVVRAAENVAERIRLRAARMIGEMGGNPVDAEEIALEDRHAVAPDGRSVSLWDVAHDALHKTDQEQIMGVGSYVSPSSPPPFAAQFAEVTVDVQTGAVRVDKLIMAVDSGVIVNPITASGQIEGGMTQALGYAVCEEMRYDEQGRARERDLMDYHIFRADEMPELETIFVQTYEPSHPFGVKAVAEIPLDGVAPAVGNAILDACGANLTSNPATPERIWRALNEK
ncbi:xanthine dehydrogenase, molybdenum binding subunit apoprotein [Longilinea arvoryzae]|uniref:Xanthine dehydrogenase, molybdenum binding subunit apoprotein n=1 Tax=Longilinea arvoryzae TaxID=360412 RepID=A0A0S7BAL8_9CHLR|nr:molybdopterin cofactor-binding domain-containing protein [Longilinea arvoryzae]GAP14703.1 xanthine dehydrogenase, molybdenum binding subunit apoprotein [Longilinea arvoryzae]